MNKNKIKAHIKDMITALKEQQTIASAGCDVVTLDQSRVGRLSRMDALQSQAMNQAAQHRRKDEILRLENSLSRIKEPDFGNCIDCDEAISQGRLLLDPAALYCIQCAQKRAPR